MLSAVAAVPSAVAAVQAGSIAAGAAVLAAVAAAAGAAYARAASGTAHDAAVTARRAVEVAERSRRAAERARLRQRVERVGELVEAIHVGAQIDPDAPGLSPWARGQMNVLDQAVVGLRRLLPETAAVAGATTPGQLAERARSAKAEVDGVLAGFARGRPVYRHRRPARAHASTRRWR